MPSRFAEAHLLGQQRLRDLASRAVGRSWLGLPGYDEQHVGLFVGQVVPVVLAAQRQSVALTEAFLARSLRRRPLGVERERLVGAAVRAGTPPEEVYRRPFVTVWSALKAGTEWEAAVQAGLARATSAAATDVQLSMRQTAQAVQDADDGIYGYQRVANGGACAFCLEVDGAYLKSADAMPLHNNCGCGLEPLTSPHPRARYLPSGEVVEPGYAVHEHGELGPVLADPAHSFDSLAA